MTIDWNCLVCLGFFVVLIILAPISYKHNVRMKRYYMRKMGAPGRFIWWSIIGIGMIGGGAYGLYTLLMEGDILGASLTTLMIAVGIIMMLKMNSDLRMDSEYELDDIIFEEELRENSRNSPLSIVFLLFFLGIGIWIFISWLSAPTPTPISARTIQETQGISLLWSREISFEHPHTSWVQLFTPNQSSVVFVSFNSLHALNILTGETLWQADVPGILAVYLYGTTFFVSSYGETQEKMPHDASQHPSCSPIDADISLLAYNAYTGEKLWGYKYDKVHGDYMEFENRNVYLYGSANHMYNKSTAEIDVDSGLLLSLQCIEGHQLSNNPSGRIPGDRAQPENAITSEEDINIQGGNPLFMVEENTNRLNIFDRYSRQIFGYIEFSGEKLHPFHFDVAVQDDLVVVYLDDSNQFFGFRLH